MTPLSSSILHVIEHPGWISANLGDSQTASWGPLQAQWHVIYWFKWPATLNYGHSIPSQIARFMGPTWGPPESCEPQIGPTNIAIRDRITGKEKICKETDIHHDSNNKHVITTYCPILYHWFPYKSQYSIRQPSTNQQIVFDRKYLVPQNFVGCHQPFSMMSSDRRLVPSLYLNQCKNTWRFIEVKKNHSPNILGRILTQHELISNCLINAFYWLWCVV